jgi:hypothetical protein
MAKATRVELVFLALHEVLTGLLTGVGGVLLTAFTQSLLEPSTGLFKSVLYPCLMGLVGLLGGIGVVGYQYLQQRERGQLIIRQLLQAVAGLLAGVAASWGVMVGLLIGFNHRIRHA